MGGNNAKNIFVCFSPSINLRKGNNSNDEEKLDN